MIIPLNFVSPGKEGSTLAPQLARLGSNEVVLLELQGSIQVEGDQAGQLAGALKIEDKVLFF